MDYLFNVFLSFKPFLFTTILLWVVCYFAVMVMKKVNTESKMISDVWKWLRPITAAILTFGLILAVVSPTNTPKNQAFDKAAEAREIHQKNQEVVVSKEITSIARKSKMSDEEREKHFSDLIKR